MSKYTFTQKGVRDDWYLTNVYHLAPCLKVAFTCIQWIYLKKSTFNLSDINGRV